MKKCILVTIHLFFSVYIVYANDNLLDEGIKYYQQKDNLKAIESLKKSISNKPSGKAYYFLGNVHMNLFEYNDAITNYKLALKSNYDINNSIFNIACAYSLLDKAEYSQKYLILNYIKGDRLLKRVDTDSDLDNYRKSEYFPKYKQIIKNISGNTPMTKNDIVNYILSEEGHTFADGSPGPGGIYFYSNGQFEEYPGGGYGGVSTGGNWKIDETNKYLIIDIIGTVQRLGEKKLIELKDKVFNANEFKFYTKLNNKTIRIPFSKIRFNCYEEYFDKYHSNNEEVIFKYHLIGDYKVYAK